MSRKEISAPLPLNGTELRRLTELVAASRIRPLTEKERDLLGTLLQKDGAHRYGVKYL